ncbi:MAG: hypothetical protein MUF18_20075 [Fimbriiglobus sp.]|jgi:hypothetical protein|nr:hypothetical protein [Fimbriiglobus sp.]
MGSDAIIYGMIQGCGVGSRLGDRKRFYRHNRSVLADLPTTDAYPPLVRDMFAVTFGPMLTWKVHAIHFGWATKNFAEDWPEWEAKFHALLRRLVWFSATVHVDCEYDGKLTAEYVILPESIEQWQQDPIQLGNAWAASYNGWIAGWDPPS